MRVFPQDIAAVLEFEKVLAEVSKYCDSRLGTDRVQKVRPIDTFAEVRKILLQTKEMTQLLQFEQHFPHDKIFDIRQTIPLLRIQDYVLSVLQCFEIQKVALLTGNVIRFFNTHAEKYPALNGFVSGTEYIAGINNAIKQIIDEAGNVRPDASPELMRIHKEMHDAIRSLGKVFVAQLQKYRGLGYLSDVDESVRNNRRVLGIQSEYKRKVPGIIPD